MPPIGLIVFVSIIYFSIALPALAWNIPGHMLSGIIAYQVLQQENPQTNDKVIAVLKKHPWYANQWHARLQDVPVAERDQVLFMQAARWPDSEVIMICEKDQDLVRFPSVKLRGPRFSRRLALAPP
jgi:hypothetical protein